MRLSINLGCFEYFGKVDFDSKVENEVVHTFLIQYTSLYFEATTHYHLFLEFFIFRSSSRERISVNIHLLWCKLCLICLDYIQVVNRFINKFTKYEVKIYIPFNSSIRIVYVYILAESVCYLINWLFPYGLQLV